MLRELVTSAAGPASLLVMFVLICPMTYLSVLNPPNTSLVGPLCFFGIIDCVELTKAVVSCADPLRIPSRRHNGCAVRRHGPFDNTGRTHASAGATRKAVRTFRFASFADPDGNGWLLQEITTRLPGQVNPATTTFSSVNDLASALRRAEAAHGEHEKRSAVHRADCHKARWEFSSSQRYCFLEGFRGPGAARGPFIDTSF